MAWTNIYPITPPAAGIRNQFTKAIVRNRLFIFQQGLDFILETDTSVPGDVTMIEHVPTFLNMTGIEGIFQARSRLGAWDTENSIYWSDTADVLDFEPDLKTRANVVVVDALKGNIIHVLPTSEGFIVYTTANIVGAQYAASDQKVFDFFEISDNLGIFSDYSVIEGEDGKQYAWTNGGLYQVEPRPGGIIPVAPEVSDYLLSFEQSPRLSYHLNRYLAIWLFGEGVDFARTIRQRNFLDAVTYFRARRPYDPEYLNNPPSWLTAINPFGKDWFDNLPYECFPEVPDKCDTVSSVNTLWGMATQEFPLLQLEKVDVTARDMDMTDATVPGAFVGIPIRVDPIEQEFVNVPLYTRPTYRLTQATRDAHQGDFNISAFARFSYDPHELLMYQAYLWQKEDLDNFNHLFDDSIMQDDDAYTINVQYEHELKSRDTVPILLSTTVEVDDLILDDSSTGTYDTAQLIDETSQEIAYVNIRTLVVEAFATKERTTTVEVITAIFELQPVQLIEPTTGGSKDGDITSGPTIVVSEVDATAGNQGIGYISELLPNQFFDDATFRNFFQLDVQQEDWLYDEINNLGFQSTSADPPPAAGYQFWSTATTINATTDRCTYGDLRAHPKNRATTKFKRTDTFTTFLEFVGLDVAGINDIYIHRVEQTTVVDYQLDRLYPELLNFPIADTEIPIRNQLFPVPLAVITKPDGSLPGAVLQRYYQDSVIQNTGILDIYAQNGWTIGPPPSGPYAPVDLPIAGGESPNIYNGIASGSFLEYFLSGTNCGRLLQQGLWPFDIDADFEPFEFPTIPDVTLPETVFLTQTGAPGPLYPTYNRAIIFDRLLERWGTADLDFRLFLDFSPINEVTYDPILEEAVTRFTFDNFLSRLGALLPNGMHTLFDDQPEESWIVYGKIGWRRSRMTMMQEIFAEFAENPNANIILESSLDRRTIDPYNLRSEQVVRAGHTMYTTVTARWFNIIVRGPRYHLTSLEFMGSPLGKE